MQIRYAETGGAFSTHQARKYLQLAEVNKRKQTCQFHRIKCQTYVGARKNVGPIGCHVTLICGKGLRQAFILSNACVDNK